MRRFAAIALALYCIAMLACGATARERYEARTPRVTVTRPCSSEISGADGSEPVLFPLCVPSDAIRYDEKRPTVLVVDTRSGYLGEETVARAVAVSPIAEAGDVTALEPGCIGSGQLVIVTAEGDVEDGSPVRISDSAREGGEAR